MKENCWWNIAHSTNHQPLHHQTHHTINGPNRCTACTLINRWPTFTRNQQLTTSVWVSQWVSGWVSEWIPATDTGASTVQQTRNYQHSCITTLTRLDQTTSHSFIHSFIQLDQQHLCCMELPQDNTTQHSMFATRLLPTECKGWFPGLDWTAQVVCCVLKWGLIDVYLECVCIVGVVCVKIDTVCLCLCLCLCCR